MSVTRLDNDGSIPWVADEGGAPTARPIPLPVPLPAPLPASALPVEVLPPSPAVTPTSVAALASTPEPPYTAVLFTSLRTQGHDVAYAATALAMVEMARQQPGFLGTESAYEAVGITLSYWVDDEAALGWKNVAEHVLAQQLGRELWYSDYVVRVATVHRAYGPSGPVSPTGRRSSA